MCKNMYLYVKNVGIMYRYSCFISRYKRMGMMIW